MDSTNDVERNGNEILLDKDDSKSSEHIMNGLSNGISKKSDSHHHKHKHKDRHSDKHKHRDKDKVRESHSNKDRHGSSEKKKEERRDKERRDDRVSLKSKDHHSKDKESHDKAKDKENRERDKEHRSKDSNSDRSKHRESSSHHKSKDDKYSGNTSSKSHSSSNKHHSSNNSSSSKKEKHSSDKHRDRPSSSSTHSSHDKKSNSSNSEKSKHKNLDAKKEVTSDVIIKSEVDVGECSTSVVKSEPLDYNEENSGRKTLEACRSVKEELLSSDNDSLVRHDGADPLDSFAQEEGEETDDSVPLAKRTHLAPKRKKEESESDEDIPLSARKKMKQVEPKKRKKQFYTDDESDTEQKKPIKTKVDKKVKFEPKSESGSPTKKKKKDDEEQEVWKWWEEEKKDDGVKWKFLEHKGPMFAPAYERLPKDVRLIYNGKEMKLSQDAEEIATFYARLIEHEYTAKEQFNANFFKDWRKAMTSEEREIIKDLSKCNFRRIYEYFAKKSEERKAMGKEEKKKIKEENEEIAKIYGVCTIDGHKEKIGNFKIEPPGLFRGRGEHPKMGMLKRRVVPEDVIINCSKDSKKPVPPEGHKWKEIRHDNTVTWLASWTENVQGQVKYVMLNPSSKLKGEKDWQKYETARKLAKSVDKIREDYREDWKSKEMRIRQRAVAMYFIDKLALRAGNEKDEDQADTVGCCSLRVEHIQLYDETNGKENVVRFDFLGKDSIRYENEVEVEKRVFKNLKLFCENKKGSDDLFDRINTTVLNKHLNELMEGLTAKVFRTYNASITLQRELNNETKPDDSIPEKILAYNRANRAVAILCNHQRSIPKSHEKSMGNLQAKIDAKREQISEAQRQYKDAKRDAKGGSAASKIAADKKKKAVERLQDQLKRLEIQQVDKDENKSIALGTSKLNYLDPRISVAWCKKYDVPIEKIYNKTQRSKFRWAIDMAGPDFVF